MSISYLAYCLICHVVAFGTPPDDSTSYVGRHGTAHMLPPAVVLISTLTNPSRKTLGHIGNTALTHNVNSFAQVIPSGENKRHVGSPTNQSRLWWFSYMPGHMIYLAPEMLYIRNKIQYRLSMLARKLMLAAPAVRLCFTYTRQYRLCWHAYKSVLFKLAAPAARLCCTYTTQDSTGYVGTLTSRFSLCWQRR
jgi:hypothetical protein